LSRCDSCEKIDSCAQPNKKEVAACIKHSEFDKPRVTWEELSPKQKALYKELKEKGII